MNAPAINTARWSLAVLFLQALCMLPVRSVAQAPDTLFTRAHKAIYYGLRYLGAPGRVPDPDAALLYAYLQDRYRLPGLTLMDTTLAQIRSNPADQLYMFLRLAEPRPCELNFLDATGSNDLAVAGMWYDELPEPSLLMQRIEEADWNEPYTATHALWAMAMAQKCFQAQLDTAVERRLVARNKEIMTTHRPLWDDVAIEALAMVQYHDSGYVPPRDYIQEVIDLQNLDGSWNWVPCDQSRASQHTTILALWALLQYKPLESPVMPRDMVAR